MGKVFFGPKEVRSGWRLFLFSCLAAILAYVLGRVAYHFGSKISVPVVLAPLFTIVSQGVLFAGVLVAAAMMARLEGRSLAEYGLPARGAFGGGFWKGIAWGFVALTALLVLMRLGRGFDFGSLALHRGEIVPLAAGWAVAYLTVACFEECLFRGYALYTLASGMGFWPAAVSLSLLFGALHLRDEGETWVGALAAAAVGIFFCLTVRRTGSLWFAIGLHAMWDYAESFLYSVPDSGSTIPGHLLNSSFHGPNWLTGGTVGPEGSVLVFVIIAAMFVMFDRLHRGVRFPLATSHAPSAALEAPPHGLRTTDD
jgi:membrane protease YdiL (CAAX protease family)